MTRFAYSSLPSRTAMFSVRKRVRPMKLNQPSVSSRITPQTPKTVSRKPVTSRNLFMDRS